MRVIVTQPHRSEYPHPLQFKKGDPFTIGERYEGPEDWQDWFFCTPPGQAGGWVPRQVIERLANGNGRALEDYNAQELDVDTGDVLTGSRILNGWVWCRRLDGFKSGWVPLKNLRVAID